MPIDRRAIAAVFAGGFTLSRTLKCVALVEMLKQSAPVFPFLPTVSFLARLALAAGLASGASWLLLNQVGFVAELSGRVGDLLKLGLAGGVFGVVYLAAAYGLRVSELHELLTFALQKVRKQA